MEVVQIPFEDAASGVPFDMQEQFIPVVPLQRGAIDPHGFGSTVIAAHDAYGHTHIMFSHNTTLDKIVGLHVHCHVGVFLCARRLRVAVVVKFEEPVPLTSRGLEGLFTRGGDGRDRRRGWEQD